VFWHGRSLFGWVWICCSEVAFLTWLANTLRTPAPIEYYDASQHQAVALGLNVLPACVAGNGFPLPVEFDWVGALGFYRKELDGSTTDMQVPE
jgi:hypothetical protein